MGKSVTNGTYYFYNSEVEVMVTPPKETSQMEALDKGLELLSKFYYLSYGERWKRKTEVSQKLTKQEI